MGIFNERIGKKGGDTTADRFGDAEETCGQQMLNEQQVRE